MPSDTCDLLAVRDTNLPRPALSTPPSHNPSETWPYYPGHQQPLLAPRSRMPPGEYRGFVVYPELTRVPEDPNAINPAGNPRTVLVPPKLLTHLQAGGQVEVSTLDGSRRWRGVINVRLTSSKRKQSCCLPSQKEPLCTEGLRKREWSEDPRLPVVADEADSPDDSTSILSHSSSKRQRVDQLY